jgi:hypothetical protein
LLAWCQRRKRLGAAIVLLVVALELLGLVVAAAVTLPGAVVQSIIARADVSVEVVAPGSLAISAREGRGEAQGVTESWDTHSSHVITKDVVLDVDPGHANLMSLLKGLRSGGKGS